MDLTKEALVGYRVAQEEKNPYRSMAMNPEQRAARNSYMRQLLKNYPEWRNLPNEVLEEMRILRVDEGRIVDDKAGCEFYIPDAGITNQEAGFRRARAMMPFEFMDKTGKDFLWTSYHTNATEGKELVSKYILKFPKFQEKGMGLYIFSGTKGSGKTMLSCCILNEISKRYAGSVKFVNTLDFLEITKKSFQGSDEEVRALYDANLLVIDDLGVQLNKEWIDTTFYRLINDRYVKRKPTIYTSNIPLDKLKMDDRITDRIESTTFQIRLPEESIRKHIRQQEKDKLLQEI